MSESIRTIRMTPSTKEEAPIAFSRPYLGEGGSAGRGGSVERWLDRGRRTAGGVRAPFRRTVRRRRSGWCVELDDGRLPRVAQPWYRTGRRGHRPLITFIANVNVIRHAGA